MSEREQFLLQVEKLANNRVLHGSESLCKLLRYLAKHALNHPGLPIKEYQIATEVFGRSEDFDPQLDSMVRVQAGRLRAKLSEYYNSEGAEDPVVVELPKGTYILTFHQRIPTGTRPHADTAAEPSWAGVRVGQSHRQWVVAAVSLAVLLLVAAGVILSLVSGRNAAQAGVQEVAPAAFRVFWNGFVSGQEEPWVVFSNAAFVGRPETGMRYLDPARDSRDLILDHYTGVGEVLAVHELDRVFNLLNHPLRVKRGSLFSLDDAKKNDLIFVGSPAENLTLLDLPGTQEFVFKRFNSGPRKGDLGIVNAHPEPEQPTIFYPSGSSQPLVEDYSVIALVNGLNPARHVMILAGTTTIGTLAAVEYVCARDSVEELLRRLGVQAGDAPKPFEALLRVKVTRGVPVGVQLVAVRNRR